VVDDWPQSIVGHTLCLLSSSSRHVALSSSVRRYAKGKEEGKGNHENESISF